ncbi:thiol reductant ABC exporter subunit CydC [Subtercola frigoramans]|uniref:ATP-binding cassette subfamily C protein CydCD n=1 Tax=Subtercola frigoramans TaxID=120298 RepID=A0ABS2L5N5_9MICO|nr:thiol reductant ABC exporter subunit CydC [Subtercola frigoramans]MBM7472344.1 ATP-binding cassette subfamily C protein CydCD [Subtercola frigoramans]
MTRTTERRSGPRLERADLRTVYLLGAVSAVKGLSLIVIAEAIAEGIPALTAGGETLRDAVLWGLGGALLRAGSSWASTVISSRAAVGVKEDLRQRLAVTALDDSSGVSGSTAVLATRGLDQLDEYYRSVLPALTNVAVIPLLLGARILFADWLSALIIVLTIPLVPVFMALIGMHTRDKVEEASTALGRLSDNLVELARGLPVLIGLGRVEEQTKTLRTISDDYRATTMQTLRTAFMSSLALELISTISVALVAVTIGIRLIGGSLTLEIGLLVLILAPECFAPFREVGAAFHAAQDGRAALARAREFVARPVPASILATGAEVTGAEVRGAVVRGAVVRVDHVTLHFAGRSEPTLNDFSAAFAHNRTTLVAGQTGSGKSSVLALLGGQLASNADGYELAGSVSGVDVRRIAWVSQHPQTVSDSVREELALYGGNTSPHLAVRVDAVLAELGLAGLADADPARLSPGELRRLALGRAVLRVDDGATLMLLDEPTAHLDAESALIVERMIERLTGTVTIVIATHEQGLAALASSVITLGETTRLREVEQATGPVERSQSGEIEPVPERESAVLAKTRTWGTVRSLWEFLSPSRGSFIFAVLLGTLSALFAVSLTAVSGWLIVRASQEPAIMYLLVAIIGVRFFGIGRSSLRYAERLCAHNSIFQAATELRIRLWQALGRNGITSRGLFRGSTAVDYLVGATDDVRDLSYRAVMPPLVAACVGLASLIAAALLYAPALWVLLVLFAVCLVLVPAVTMLVDKSFSQQQHILQSALLTRFVAMLGASRDLRTNAIDGQVRTSIARVDAELGVAARRGAWALGLGHALTVLGCCLAAMGMLVVCAPFVVSGGLPLELAAVFVLLPLALIESMAAVVDAVQLWPSLAAALAKVADFVGDDIPEAMDGRTVDLEAIGHETISSPVHSLEFSGVTAGWPGSAAPTFSDVSFRAVAGEWVMVEGPSGSGKSTLLAVALGFLQPRDGRVLLDGRASSNYSGSELRRHVTWCPQEGHLFDSTLRGNLLISRARGDAPSEPEMIEALERVGLGSFVGSLQNGLDTRVGSEGEQLSGGQRQRVAVARAFLAGGDIVLLDEPTAHLDADAAESLVTDLRIALSDKIVILVTHHCIEAQAGDVRVRLAASTATAGRAARMFEEPVAV